MIGTVNAMSIPSESVNTEDTGSSALGVLSCVPGGTAARLSGWRGVKNDDSRDDVSKGGIKYGGSWS